VAHADRSTGAKGPPGCTAHLAGPSPVRHDAPGTSTVDSQPSRVTVDSQPSEVPAKALVRRLPGRPRPTARRDCPAAAGDERTQTNDAPAERPHHPPAGSRDRSTEPFTPR